MKMQYCNKHRLWVDLDLYILAKQCHQHIPLDCFCCSESIIRTITQDVSERYEKMCQLYRKIDEETHPI